MDEIIAATGTKDNDDGEIDYARKKFFYNNIFFSKSLYKHQNKTILLISLQKNNNKLFYFKKLDIKQLDKMSDDEVMRFEITDDDLNNEFNYDLKRPKMSKNQSTYGIWADDSVGDDDPGKNPIKDKKRYVAKFYIVFPFRAFYRPPLQS